MLDAYQVSVGGSAVPLLRYLVPGPMSVTITNGGTANVYIGSGGTATTPVVGAPLPPGGWVQLPGYGPLGLAALWAITTGGTVPTGVFVTTAI